MANLPPATIGHGSRIVEPDVVSEVGTRQIVTPVMLQQREQRVERFAIYEVVLSSVFAFDGVDSSVENLFVHAVKR